MGGLGVIDILRTLWGLTKRYGWIPMAGTLLYSALSGNDNPPPDKSVPLVKTPVTKEKYNQVKSQILTMLRSTVGGETTGALNPYLTEALGISTQLSSALGSLSKEYKKTNQAQAQKLYNLMSALPLVSRTGVGYWNQPVVSALENSITDLVHQALPTDLSWKSVLRAKYARRALQSILPAYSNLVYSTRETVTPSPVVPSLLTSATALETAPIKTMLTALPEIYNLKQKALLGVGQALSSAETEAYKRQTNLFQSLMKQRQSLNTTALKILGELGQTDPAISQLLVRRLSPVMGALGW